MFPDFILYWHLKLSETFENYVIAIYIMSWLTIFMISGSNQQLQQESEYTLLKSQLVNFKNAIWR